MWCQRGLLRMMQDGKTPKDLAGSEEVKYMFDKRQGVYSKQLFDASKKGDTLAIEQLLRVHSLNPNTRDGVCFLCHWSRQPLYIWLLSRCLRPDCQ
jgi:hypothetical protein